VAAIETRRGARVEPPNPKPPHISPGNADRVIGAFDGGEAGDPPAFLRAEGAHGESAKDGRRAGQQRAETAAAGGCRTRGLVEVHEGAVPQRPAAGSPRIHSPPFLTCVSVLCVVTVGGKRL
jgi:hypothetical protein